MIADYPEYHPPKEWEPENNDDEDDFLEDDNNDSIGCLFPDRCLMPGEHLTSECHTVEMLEDYEHSCNS